MGVLVVVAAAEGAAVWGSSAPLRPVAQTAGIACGVERWPVKILGDPMASQVKLTPHPSSVPALRRLRVPPSLPQKARNRPVETSSYRVHARLVESKFEDDSDFHLVIADPRTGETMIVEFPALYCTLTAKPALRRRMQSARSAFIRACGAPSRSGFDRLRGKATISGVGFFDFWHGQNGVAPNAIELHPVLGFSGSCHRAGAPPPPPRPPGGGRCAASYPDECIPPPPPDLDCSEIPYRTFRVLWNVPDPDPHHFDGDHDGFGCES